jgi:hypothetical protein
MSTTDFESTFSSSNEIITFSELIKFNKNSLFLHRIQKISSIYCRISTSKTTTTDATSKEDNMR